MKLVVFSLAALLAWAGLVAFQVSASFGFAATGMLGLAVLGSVAVFFVAVLAGIFSKRWRAACVCGFMVIVVFTSSLTASLISTRQREASMVAAEPVIVALERFHAAMGSYPRELDDLIPVYLAGKPRTKMGFRGDSFLYWCDADGFELGFSVPPFILYSYDSKSKEWRICD
jgi:hypothetical protein